MLTLQKLKRTAMSFVNWRAEKHPTIEPIAAPDNRGGVNDGRDAASISMVDRIRKYEYPIDDEWA